MNMNVDYAKVKDIAGNRVNRGWGRAAQSTARKYFQYNSQ